MSRKLPDRPAFRYDVTAAYKQAVINADGNIEITFEIPTVESNRVVETLAWLNERFEPKWYRLQISESFPKRSGSQNNLLWEIIRKISMTEGSDVDTVYTNLLKMADVRSTVLLLPEDAIKQLLADDAVRAIDVIGDRKVLKENADGTQKITPVKVVRVFTGSSSFTTKEFNTLIDKAMEYANAIGINTDIYEK